MAKGEFDMLYLCAGGGGAMIFSFDKSTSLEGGSEKKPLRWSGGGFKKMKGKNKKIIIAHPLDKLWMLPYFRYPGVKRRKLGSPFSLTLFLAWFWHFKLFLPLWRMSQQYKPTPKKFKDGANKSFRGLIIANTYSSSMRSRVSDRFQIDSSYTCGRAKTMRKRYEWTRIFLKRRKKVAFSNEYGRIRVERA